MSEQPEMTIEPSGGLSLNVRELWHYRELFYFFSWRDIKVKYKQAVLGLLWVVLQPVMMMVVFTFFIGRAFHIDSEGIPYPVFAFSGILLWTTFAAAVTNAGSSMITNTGIIQKIYFPRLIIPLSSLLVALADFMVALVVFIVFVMFYPGSVNFLDTLWCWPLAIMLMVLGALGLGCWLSALTIKYRDFRFIVPFMIQILFFVTPILYPLSVIKTLWIRYLLALNPMHGAISLFRAPLMQAGPDYGLVGISFVSGIVFVIIGLWYFKKTELYFADLS